MILCLWGKECLIISVIWFSLLQNDVFLICSNAMQYNSPETVYHKQVTGFYFFFSPNFLGVFFFFVVFVHTVLL